MSTDANPDNDRTTNRLTNAAREVRHLPEVVRVKTSLGGVRPTLRVKTKATDYGEPIPKPVMRTLYEHGLGVFSVDGATVSATVEVDRP